MSEIETNEKGEQVMVERSVVRKVATVAQLDAGLRVVGGRGGICTTRRQLLAALEEQFPGCRALAAREKKAATPPAAPKKK